MSCSHLSTAWSSSALASSASSTRGRSAPRSGLGLAGLAERAELAGGTLTHEVSPGAEFVLETWLPWPA